MNAIELISQDLFDKVRSRFSNLQMGSEAGAVTVVPQEARFFDFDFVVEGDNLGRVSISINELGSLKVYYSQGIVEDTNSSIQKFWFDFLKEMRQFAKRRMLRFDTRDISKGNLDKNDFAYLATQQAAQQASAQSTVPQESNMTTESTMYGSSKSSYRPLEKTLLIIRHNAKVGEDRGARSRPNNIKAVFIQNEAGERFKYPYAHLAGAKAMQRHVSNGGTPFDPAGASIMQMSEQIKQLSTFKRQVGNIESLTNEARGIVDRVGSKLSDLRATIEHIAKQSHYEAWRESLDEAIAEMTEIDAATIEDYKSKFTVSSYKEDLTQYFPLLYKVMQETSTVDLEDYVGEDKEECTCTFEGGQDECPIHSKEDIKKESFDAFEEWADEIAEGPDRSTIPAQFRKDKGEKPLTKQELDAEAEKNISHPKTLARNSGRDVKEGGYSLEPTSYQDWKASIEDRLAKGEIEDPAEIAAEIGMYFPKFNDEVAMRVAKSMFMSAGGEDPMAKHRVAPPDDGMGNVSQSGDEEDDDDSFLNRLRSQAKGGSIKPGVDTGGVEMEEMDQGKLPKDAMTEIARIVMTSINRGDDPDLVGTVPRGDEAIKIETTKRFGQKAGDLAYELLQIKKEEVKRDFENRQQMESMRRLSGLPPLSEAEKKTMSRAAKGIMKYGKKGMQALRDAEAEGKDLEPVRAKFNKYKDK
jgi:hypothetical protein